VGADSLPAYQEPGRDDFDSAIQANNRQDYLDCITHFETAIDKGLSQLRLGYAYVMMGQIKLLQFEDIEKAVADLAKALDYHETLYETAHMVVQYLYTFYRIADAYDKTYRLEALFDQTRSHVNYSLDPVVTMRVQNMLNGIKWHRE